MYAQSIAPFSRNRFDLLFVIVSWGYSRQRLDIDIFNSLMIRKMHGPLVCHINVNPYLHKNDCSNSEDMPVSSFNP